MRIRFYLSLFVIAVLLNFYPANAEAHPYKKDVLGVSIDASDVEVPAVSAGPGLLLPDSPLYFLDNTFQSIKLLFITAPEKKAEMHQMIAQERLAELRVMMAKDHSEGIKRALIEYNRENDSTGKELENASLKGKNINKLASSINDSMKQQREFLDKLANQSNGSLKMQLKTAKEELVESKVEIEDYLPEDVLLKEVEESIENEIKEDIEEASESARGLEQSIEVLTKLASEAAIKNQDKREEALLKTIDTKNENLKRREEKVLELKRKKEEKVYKLKKEAVESARKIVENAKTTAQKLDEMKSADELIN